MNEEKVLNAATQIAEAITSMHFHNQGLMDDQVDPVKWNEYSDKVRNAVLDAADKYSA